MWSNKNCWCGSRHNAWRWLADMLCCYSNKYRVAMISGLAHVCVVTDSMTITRARIEVPIPRKRRGSCTNHDKVRHCCYGYLSSPSPLQAVQRFYDTVMQALLRHVRFEGERYFVCREFAIMIHCNVIYCSGQVHHRGQSRICQG